MQEFGTLRAMGFNRRQGFSIVFLEILILSLGFFILALAVVVILIHILDESGIYIGKGSIAYALGGEAIFPVFEFADILPGLLIITLFSFFAPLKPGLRLCYQKITNLLVQDQKPVSAVALMIKSVAAAGRVKKYEYLKKEMK
jgi:ABC-type lipoprotein release transport system permease subunit